MKPAVMSVFSFIFVAVQLNNLNKMRTKTYVTVTFEIESSQSEQTPKAAKATSFMLRCISRLGWKLGSIYNTYDGKITNVKVETKTDK